MIVWQVTSKSATGTYITPFAKEREARKVFNDLCRQQESAKIEFVRLESIRHEQDTRPDNDRPGQHAG